MNNLNGKNKTLFYWLLISLKNPIHVQIIWKNHATATALSSILFKVYKKDRTLMYSTIYSKTIRNGTVQLFIEEPLKHFKKRTIKVNEKED